MSVYSIIHPEKNSLFIIFIKNVSGTLMTYGLKCKKEDNIFKISFSFN